MPAVTFESKLADDGSLAIPRTAVEELGLHPGDEVRVRLEAANGTRDQASLNVAVSELLDEARQLAAEAGRPSDDPYELAFGEMVKEKYRRQGFIL